MSPSELQVTNAALARLHRAGANPTPAQLDEARRNHATARIAAYIEKTYATCPPLTTAQQRRLTSLIKGR